MSVRTASHLEDLRIQARNLPEVPGVYFWKDARGRTLYIGKAINLRARVTSYFSSARRDRRTADLLSRARSIEHEVAATELDALFRESTLIKQVQPPFNRALRTPRQLFYLKFDVSMTDPYMEATRELVEDGSLYFGPFRTGSVLRETMAFLHAVLPLRKCTRMKPHCKPCLYHQMDTCAAPPLGEEYRQRHRDAIGHLADLLDGRSDRVQAWLEAKRDKLSEMMLYERAAEVQRRIDALDLLLQRQALLEGAVQCRCVLIRDEGTARQPRRLLLVAHGCVISTRPADAVTVAEALPWVHAHLAVARAAAAHAEELDAAAVLERWIACRRDLVRWVAIPDGVDRDDLAERVGYVLAEQHPEPPQGPRGA